MDYELILPYIPNLRRYARALVGDRHAADDLVQDTLERAVRKFHLWRPGNLRAWLFSIMHNVFVNQLKAGRTPPSVEADETLAAPVSTVDSLDLIDIERALALLPEEQRAVVLLVGLEEMTYAEVSSTLGIPMGTVMSRLSRARERMRQVIDGESTQPNLRVVR